MARIASFRRHLVPLILLALLALLPSFGGLSIATGADLTSQDAVNGDATYRDPAGAYTFTLPNGWRTSAQDDRGISFTDPANHMELSIVTTSVNGRALRDSAQEETAPFRRQPGYRESRVGEQDLTVGGEPARGIRFYSDSTDVNQLSTVAVTVTHKGTLYLLRFRVGQDQEKATGPTIVSILNSWQFT